MVFTPTVHIIVLHVGEGSSIDLNNPSLHAPIVELFVIKRIIIGPPLSNMSVITVFETSILSA